MREQLQMQDNPLWKTGMMVKGRDQEIYLLHHVRQWLHVMQLGIQWRQDQLRMEEVMIPSAGDGVRGGADVETVESGGSNEGHR